MLLAIVQRLGLNLQISGNLDFFPVGPQIFYATISVICDYCYTKLTKQTYRDSNTKNGNLGGKYCNIL